MSGEPKDKIVIFGDSYSNKERVGEVQSQDYGTIIPWSWSNAIEKDYDVLNYSYAGSSENYTRNKVYEYLDSPDYSQTDTIIFFTTSIWRFPFLNHFDKTNMQAVYGSVSLEYESGYSKDEWIDHPDYNKIKDNPQWYINLHDIMTNESEYLYQQRLMFALFLKQLPNKVIYYDTFFSQHYNMIPGNVCSDSRDYDMEKKFNNFENVILKDTNSFIFQKSILARECGSKEGYRSSIDWKVHNHMNYDQHTLFIEQMRNTIDTFENCFDEKPIVDRLYNYKKLKEIRS